MAKNDVTVTIDLLKPAGIIGFGKPFIITTKAGGAEFKNYSDLAAVAVDYPVGTEAYKQASMLLGAGDNRPAVIAIAAYGAGGVATALEVLQRDYTKDWYFLLTTDTTIADVIAMSNYVEGQGRKMFAIRANDLDDVTALKATGNETSFVLYHSNAAEYAKYPEAAWVGGTGSRTVGTVTWKFKRLIGIVADDLDDAELTDVHDAGGNAYVTKAGTAVTSEGLTLSGEYIDTIMAKHWVLVNIEEQVQTLLNVTPKVPFDNNGIAQIEGSVRTVLQIAFRQGIIADDGNGVGLYSTDFPTRAETTAPDRAARILRDGKFEFELAGAIHESVIKGTITV